MLSIMAVLGRPGLPTSLDRSDFVSVGAEIEIDPTFTQTVTVDESSRRADPTHGQPCHPRRSPGSCTGTCGEDQWQSVRPAFGSWPAMHTSSWSTARPPTPPDGRCSTLELAWSRFIAGSDIDRLNQASSNWPGPVPIGAATLTLIEKMTEARQMTDGRYDPSLLPALVDTGYPPASNTPTNRPRSTDPAMVGRWTASASPTHRSTGERAPWRSRRE